MKRKRAEKEIIASSLKKKKNDHNNNNKQHTITPFFQNSTELIRRKQLTGTIEIFKKEWSELLVHSKFYKSMHVSTTQTVNLREIKSKFNIFAKNLIKVFFSQVLPEQSAFIVEGLWRSLKRDHFCFCENSSQERGIVLNCVPGSGKTWMLLRLSILNCILNYVIYNRIVNVLLVTYSSSLKGNNRIELEELIQKLDFLCPTLKNQIEAHSVHSCALKFFFSEEENEEIYINGSVDDHCCIAATERQNSIEAHKDFLQNVNSLFFDECQDLSREYTNFLNHLIKFTSGSGGGGGDNGGGDVSTVVDVNIDIKDKKDSSLSSSSGTCQVVLAGQIQQRVYGWKGAKSDCMLYPHLYFPSILQEEWIFQRISTTVRFGHSIANWMNEKLNPKWLQLAMSPKWWATHGEKILEFHGNGIQALDHVFSEPVVEFIHPRPIGKYGYFTADDKENEIERQHQFNFVVNAIQRYGISNTLFLTPGMKNDKSLSSIFINNIRRLWQCVETDKSTTTINSHRQVNYPTFQTYSKNKNKASIFKPQYFPVKTFGTVKGLQFPLVVAVGDLSAYWEIQAYLNLQEDPDKADDNIWDLYCKIYVVASRAANCIIHVNFEGDEQFVTMRQTPLYSNNNLQSTNQIKKSVNKKDEDLKKKVQKEIFFQKEKKKRNQENKNHKIIILSSNKRITKVVPTKLLPIECKGSYPTCILPAETLMLTTTTTTTTTTTITTAETNKNSQIQRKVHLLQKKPYQTNKITSPKKGSIKKDLLIKPKTSIQPSIQPKTKTKIKTKTKTKLKEFFKELRMKDILDYVPWNSALFYKPTLISSLPSVVSCLSQNKSSHNKEILSPWDDLSATTQTEDALMVGGKMVVTDNRETAHKTFLLEKTLLFGIQLLVAAFFSKTRLHLSKFTFLLSSEEQQKLVLKRSALRNFMTRCSGDPRYSKAEQQWKIWHNILLPFQTNHQEKLFENFITNNNLKDKTTPIMLTGKVNISKKDWEVIVEIANSLYCILCDDSTRWCESHNFREKITPLTPPFSNFKFKPPIPRPIKIKINDVKGNMNSNIQKTTTAVEIATAVPKIQNRTKFKNPKKIIQIHQEHQDQYEHEHEHQKTKKEIVLTQKEKEKEKEKEKDKDKDKEKDKEKEKKENIKYPDFASFTTAYWRIEEEKTKLQRLKMTQKGNELLRWFPLDYIQKAFQRCVDQLISVQDAFFYHATSTAVSEILNQNKNKNKNNYQENKQENKTQNKKKISEQKNKKDEKDEKDEKSMKDEEDLTTQHSLHSNNACHSQKVQENDTFLQIEFYSTKRHKCNTLYSQTNCKLIVEPDIIIYNKTKQLYWIGYLRLNYSQGTQWSPLSGILDASVWRVSSQEEKTKKNDSYSTNTNSYLLSNNQEQTAINVDCDLQFIVESSQQAIKSSSCFWINPHFYEARIVQWNENRFNSLDFIKCHHKTYLVKTDKKEKEEKEEQEKEEHSNQNTNHWSLLKESILVWKFIKHKFYPQQTEIEPQRGGVASATDIRQFFDLFANSQTTTTTTTTTTTNNRHQTIFKKKEIEENKMSSGFKTTYYSDFCRWLNISVVQSFQKNSSIFIPRPIPSLSSPSSSLKKETPSVKLNQKRCRAELLVTNNSFSNVKKIKTK